MPSRSLLGCMDSVRELARAVGGRFIATLVEGRLQTSSWVDTAEG